MSRITVLDRLRKRHEHAVLVSLFTALLGCAPAAYHEARALAELHRTEEAAARYALAIEQEPRYKASYIELLNLFVEDKYLSDFALARQVSRQFLERFRDSLTMKEREWFAETSASILRRMEAHAKTRATRVVREELACAVEPLRRLYKSQAHKAGERAETLALLRQRKDDCHQELSDHYALESEHLCLMRHGGAAEVADKVADVLKLQETTYADDLWDKNDEASQDMCLLAGFALWRSRVPNLAPQLDSSIGELGAQAMSRTDLAAALDGIAAEIGGSGYCRQVAGADRFGRLADLLEEPDKLVALAGGKSHALEEYVIHDVLVHDAIRLNSIEALMRVQKGFHHYSGLHCDEDTTLDLWLAHALRELRARQVLRSLKDPCEYSLVDEFRSLPPELGGPAEGAGSTYGDPPTTRAITGYLDGLVKCGRRVGDIDSVRSLVNRALNVDHKRAREILAFDVHKRRHDLSSESTQAWLRERVDLIMRTGLGEGKDDTLAGQARCAVEAAAFPAVYAAVEIRLGNAQSSLRRSATEWESAGRSADAHYESPFNSPSLDRLGNEGLASCRTYKSDKPAKKHYRECMGRIKALRKRIRRQNDRVDSLNRKISKHCAKKVCIDWDYPCAKYKKKKVKAYNVQCSPGGQWYFEADHCSCESSNPLEAFVHGSHGAYQCNQVWAVRSKCVKWGKKRCTAKEERCRTLD